jgi:hypothetical protein
MSVLDVFGAPLFFLARIQQVVVDAVLSEEHVYDSEITESPIEDGTPVSDNQVLLPVILNMECRISDATANLAQLNYPGRSTEAYKELVALQKKKETITVVTGINVYENMLIKRIGIPRSSRDGNSIKFSLVMKEILVVGTDAKTNRDLIAEDVQHTFMAVARRGLIGKVAFNG